jgi:hypothetical protein
MNVICTKSTKKLIKDATYKVASLNNFNSKSYAFFRPTIRIYLNDNTIHTFSLESFKPTVGDTFQQINWMCPDYKSVIEEREQMKIDKNLKSGDYVIPVHDGLKTVVKGRKYKVTEVTVNEHKSSSGYVSWTDIKIKLEGSNRFYTSYNFRKCTNQETRELSLSEIFDESVDTEKVNRYKRKFDYLSESEKRDILIELFVNSSYDKYRNNMDIFQWIIEKTGKSYKVVDSDLDLIRNLTISEVVELLK